MESKLEQVKRFLRGRNVLVTGGGGFIGSRLAKRLSSYGARVTVFDRMVNELNSEIRYIEGDIRDYEAIYKAMKGKSVVFHLSAILGVEKILKVPYEVLEVNLQGTVNALKAARELSVERFLFSSSSEVYGEPRKLPIAEDDLKAPVSVYGVSKLAGEAYCQAYREQFGLNTTCVRYFNVYGPGQRERFVIPIFISRVLRGQSPIIYGQGSQSRCYTFVDDAVEGTILATSLDSGIGQVFNIGNDVETSILELANYIIELGGNNLYPEYKAFGDGIRVESREILKRRPDITKARSLLGFQITVPWQEGVKRFMNWYIKERENHRIRRRWR